MTEKVYSLGDNQYQHVDLKFHHIVVEGSHYEVGSQLAGFLKQEATPRFRRLDDLTAIDESARRQPKTYPNYTLVYHLLSFEPASRLRLKVALQGEEPVTQSVTDIWL